MKKNKIISVVIIMTIVMLLGNAALFTNCSSKLLSKEKIFEEESDELADTLDVVNLPGANTQFGFNLYRELIAEDKDENIFISPFSILLALAMAYNGALGDTNLDMAEALEFKGFDLTELNQGFHDLLLSIKNADSDIDLAIANSIWQRLGSDVDKDFIERNKKYYNSEVRELDFSSPDAVDTINEWIDDATMGKIDKMLTEVSADAVMYLINAIYFKGNWTYEFDEEFTEEEDFYLLDGSTKKVPMMAQREDFRYLKESNYSSVRLPYGQEKMAMYIILPDRGVDIDTVIGSFDSEEWQNYLSSFSETEVELKMPKFKMEYGIKLLNDALTNLGMGIAFSSDADFSGINPDTFISRVLHKAVIEVNEKGSEAAAATVVEMDRGGDIAETVEFIVDRPFFFVISDDRTGSMLFMGKVVEP
ncbi:MAG: serpin family protein [Actinomycetia bacterium]|nr:serpin family protein [Actinomycetes bacterium]